MNDDCFQCKKRDIRNGKIALVLFGVVATAIAIRYSLLWNDIAPLAIEFMAFIFGIGLCSEVEKWTEKSK